MLLLSSSSRSTRGARTTEDPTQPLGISATKFIESEIASSATNDAPSLRELIDQHSAAVQDAKSAKAGRLALLKYQPKCAGEASLKLAYLTSYLIATKSSLTAKEMRMLASPRARRPQ